MSHTVNKSPFGSFIIFQKLEQEKFFGEWAKKRSKRAGKHPVWPLDYNDTTALQT